MCPAEGLNRTSTRHTAGRGRGQLLPPTAAHGPTSQRFKVLYSKHLTWSLEPIEGRWEAGGASATHSPLHEAHQFGAITISKGLRPLFSRQSWALPRGPNPPSAAQRHRTDAPTGTRLASSQQAGDHGDRQRREDWRAGEAKLQWKGNVNPKLLILLYCAAA